MSNVFSWEYIPPIFDPKVNLYKADRSNSANWVTPPRVKSPEGICYTLAQINEELTPLEFGNAKQSELLKVLLEFQEPLENGEECHPGLFIDP